MIRILIVDEDKFCRREIKYQLSGRGYSVTSMECLEHSVDNEKQYDLILLGNYDFADSFYIENLKNNYNCAVILLSNASGVEEIIRCMKSTADDYLLKPIREKELLAKVKYQLAGKKEQSKRNLISGLIFDNSENAIIVKCTTIRLTKNEYRLCRLLAQNPLVTLTKENIYNSIYAMDVDTQMRTITEYIYSVRKKFKKVNIDPIKTIWGTGYRWVYNNEIDFVGN